MMTSARLGPAAPLARRLAPKAKLLMSYRPTVRLVSAFEIDRNHRVHAEAATIALSESQRSIVRRAGGRRTTSSKLGLGMETDLELGVPAGRALEAIDGDYTHPRIVISRIGDAPLQRDNGATFHRFGVRGVEPLVESFLSWRIAARYRPPVVRPGYSRAEEIWRGPHLSLLGTRSSHNLYHLLIEALPRALCVEPVVDGSPVTLLVPADRAPFWEPFLTALARRGFLVREVDGAGLVRIEDLLLVDLGTKDMCGYADPAASARLAEMMAESFGPPPADSPSRIYISRAGTTRRAMLNEAEVLPELEARGFTVIRPEELSYQKQYWLFAGAEVIAAPHGAALANLIHSSDAEVVVAQSTDHTMPHYLVLALSRGLGYHHVEGPMRDPSMNFVVDAADFLAAIDQALG